MALYRCTSGSGGGMTETTLWTNTSPKVAFSTTSVDLGQSASNFDLLKIGVRSRNNANAAVRDCYFAPSSLLGSGGTGSVPFYIAGEYSGTYVRSVSLSSNDLTHLQFGSTALGVGSKTDSTSNYAIPQNVVGIKLS